LTEEEELYAWGESEHGNCGTGQFEDIILIPKKMLLNWEEDIHIVDIKCGGGHTLVLLEDGRLFSCGMNM
jgi:alpha-tubulin suppressor-like RCC1 family protein